jgi:hypothetical protein
MLDDSETRVTLERVSNGAQFRFMNDFLKVTDGIALDEDLNLDFYPDLRLGPSERFVVLDDLSGKRYTVSYTDIVGKAKLKIAWALTVHKFQGNFFYPSSILDYGYEEEIPSARLTLRFTKLCTNFKKC